MTVEQQAHLQRILDAFSRECTDKYVSGQQEHGGNLWEKPHMLDNAILEAIDLVVYLLTLREQGATTTPPKPQPCASSVPSVKENGT